MSTYSKIRFSFLLILFFCAVGQAQVFSDSLEGKDYDYLKQRSFENLETPEKAEAYVSALLKLGKEQNSDTITLRGYYYFALMSDFENSIIYFDSIINFGDLETRNDRFLPLAYLQKGYLYYGKGDSKNCLDNYLMARKISKNLGYDDIHFMATWSVGVYKDLIGQEDEALSIYKEQFDTVSKKSIAENESDYFSVLSALANSYISNGKLDSATTYNRLGAKNALKFDKKIYYPRFVLKEGINLYEKESYAIASDSLTKAIDLLTETQDSMNLAMGFLFKAKALNQLNSNPTISNSLLKTADTIVSRQQQVHPEFAMVYEDLYTNYKRTDSVENQLIYLEKLIAYNQKVEEEFKGIDATIAKQYDTPELLLAKEEIITGLQEKNKANKRNIYLLSIFLASLCILSFYYYRKRIVYKKRYELLLQKDFVTEKPAESMMVTKTKTKVPEDILIQLLPKIDEFEKNEGYLDSSISLDKMAKSLGTNSNYLSKTINFSKNKNFSSYLSDLRINYAIEALKTDTKLLNYTVKAIAAEVGFGNAESFTKAFYAKTNLYPSYFIKQLKKER